MAGSLKVKAYGERYGVIYVPLGCDAEDGQTVAVCRKGVGMRKVQGAIKRVKMDKIVPGTPQRLREVVTGVLEEAHLLWR